MAEPPQDGMPPGPQRVLAVATITGLGGLYLLQHLAQESAVDALLRRRDDHIVELRSAIQQRVELSQALAGQLQQAGTADAVRLAASLPAQGYTGVALFDRRGTAVAEAGIFQAPTTMITLSLPGAPQLLWHQGYWLRLDLPMVSSALAHLRLEGGVGRHTRRHENQPQPVVDVLIGDRVLVDDEGDVGFLRCGGQGGGQQGQKQKNKAHATPIS